MKRLIFYKEEDMQRVLITFLTIVLLTFALAIFGCSSSGDDDDTGTPPVDDDSGADDDAADDDAADDDAVDDDAADDDTVDDDTADDDTADDDTADDDSADDDTVDDDTTDDDTGTVILDENFDGMTIDQPPSAPWEVDVTNATILVELMPTKTPGGNVVYFDKTGSGANDYANLVYSFATPLTTNFSFTFDWYVGSAAVPGFRLWSVDSPTDWNQLIYTIEYDTVSTQFQIYHTYTGSNVSSVPCATLVKGVFVSVSVEIDFTAKTSNTLINGTACASDTPFFKNTNTQVKTSNNLIFSSTPASQMMIDSVYVVGE